MTKDKGLIYILTNPSFPNYQKIGKTKNLKERLRSLNDRSCLPFSFRVYATYEVDDNLSMVEEEIFKIIDNVDDTLRAKEETERGSLRQREFFAIDKEKAYSVIESIAKLRGDVNRLQLSKLSKKEAKEAALAEEVEKNITHRKGERFCFVKKGITKGDKLCFIEDDTTIVEVVSDKPPIVSFENKEWKLSPLAAELKERNGTSTPSGAYQGAAYFTYNGTRLLDLPDID